MNKPSLRERILEAADTIARERGVANLTLDLVAEQAAVSKGGLLYHFTTKEALLAGMVERSLDRYRSLLHAAIAGRHSGLALMLIERGAPIDGPDGAGHTPLHIATENGMLEVVKAILVPSAESH